jgi:SAM-dependent methyltransferase
LKDDEKNETISRYNDRLKKYGYDPKTLGWVKGKQEVRFQVLSEIGNIDNSSIMDIGCGFGDLYGFLKNKGLNIRYTGVDLNSSLIDIAEKIYPEAKFCVLDCDEEEIEGSYDWIFASGVFNFRLEDNHSFIAGILNKMFRACNKGMAADFLSSYVDYQNEGAFHSRPEEIFSLGKSMSRRVALRHDYMPFEFCVYVYKDDRFNERTVFEEYDRNLK